MKKYLVFIIGLLTCFSLTVSTISADDELKDNSLQIDSSRLEENKTTDVSSSLDLTKNLFSNSDRALLEKIKRMLQMILKSNKINFLRKKR